MVATDVLIAGAGPFGLMLACELGRRGIDCLLLDCRTRIADGVQANATQARTMEHFRRPVAWRGFAAEVAPAVLDQVTGRTSPAVAPARSVSIDATT